MRQVCCLCGKKAKARCNGKNGGATYKGPLCAAHYERLRRYGDPTFKPEFRSDKGRVFRTLDKRYKTSEGYFNVFRPLHPNAKKSGYVLEHRWVMSCHLGRPLKNGETVHHKNGDRGDNRIENLELRDGPHGKGSSVEDLEVWAIEFLRDLGYSIRSCE